MTDLLTPEPKPVAVPFDVERKRILAEADALPESAVRAVDTDTPTLVSSLLDTGEKLQSLGPLFDYHRIGRRALDNVRGYAIVALEEELSQQPSPSTEAEALATGNRMLTHFKNEAGVMTARGIMPESAFADMPHTGYLNVGLAMVRFPKILRDNWDLIANETRLTREDLDAAEAHGHVLIAIAGDREARAAQGQSTVQVDRRTRTFTLLDQALDELRPIVTFLLRNSSEPIELYLPTKPKKKAKAKKTSPGELKAPVPKKEANADAPKADAPKAPVPTSSGNIPAPREEDKAAE